MSTPSSADTLLIREPRRSQATGLPPDLLAQSADRLRAGALVYAFVFFMSDPLPALLFTPGRFLSDPLRWLPSVLSIGSALTMAIVAGQRRLDAGSMLTAGLVFEVLGSFGIAAAQCLDTARYATEPPWAGLSWVAVWMIAFTVTVPNPPRRALVAALASSTSVPIVVGLVMVSGLAPVRLTPARFFVLLVVPYLLVVLVAYIGARVVYHLGTELTRARELGSYRLVERLGQGGMGEVWRAQHRLLARPAAVKLIRPEVLGGSRPERQAELYTRFTREAQATASLRSPHTVELYDFGVAADGSFYYAMELLDGFDLQTLVDRFGPVPAGRAVHLLTQICHSLAEAHGGGLIHRDVKPANIYACRYGRDVDFVKVLDFGLVRSLRDEPWASTGATGLGAVGGTPGFMSPEQVLGDRELDGRSDIYAVGCVAYWLLTGELVFAGRSAMETMLQHANDTPLAPSQRTELEIPEALDRVIMSCLEKDPDRRPATAEALAAALAQVPVREGWNPRRTWLWWDAHSPAPTSPATSVAAS